MQAALLRWHCQPGMDLAPTTDLSQPSLQRAWTGANCRRRYRERPWTVRFERPSARRRPGGDARRDRNISQLCDGVATARPQVSPTRNAARARRAASCTSGSFQDAGGRRSAAASRAVEAAGLLVAPLRRRTVGSWCGNCVWCPPHSRPRSLGRAFTCTRALRACAGREGARCA